MRGPRCSSEAHRRPRPGREAERRSLRMDKAGLLQAMTDAYIARRRKGAAFDDIAATQAYWECQPQMSVGQARAFTDTGKGNSVAGWKIVLRGRLPNSEGTRLPPPRRW